MGTTILVVALALLVILAIVIGAGWFRRRQMTRSVIRGRGEAEAPAPATRGAYSDDEHGFVLGSVIDNEDIDGFVDGGRRPFRLATREPWFEYATKGKKTVWGRLRTGPVAEDARNPLKVGDDVTVARSRAKGDETEYGRPYRYVTEIASMKEYDSFKDMVKGEGLANVFPGAKTAAAGLKVYAEFYDDAAQQGAKVVAIGLRPPSKEALEAAAAPPPARAAAPSEA